MKYKDEEGKEYEISYSQKMQMEIVKELRLNNYLKVIVASLLVLVFMLFLLVVTGTGVIGSLLTKTICT